MKTSLAIFVLFLGVSGFAAMPAVNDFSRFDGIATLNGTSVAFTIETRTTSFDSVLGIYGVTHSTTIPGKPSKNEISRVAAKDMVTTAQVTDILKNCLQYNGNLETLNLKAGKFDTCRLPWSGKDMKGFIWVGMAPYGFVQMDQTNRNGQRVVSKLESYVFGAP